MPATALNAASISVDCDPARLDIALIHGFLASSYWARDIPMALLQSALEHSLCFGLYDGRQQIGFARVISDYATFAYLADVFVVEEYRGHGHSKLLMAAVMAHPRLQDLRRWMLVTRDAHALYAPFGFKALAAPERVMERHDPDVYARALMTQR